MAVSTAHYNSRNRYSPWKVIEDWYSDFPTAHSPAIVYYLGDALAYMCRAGHKDGLIDDLQKARDYITQALEVAKKDEPTSEQDVPPISFTKGPAWWYVSTACKLRCTGIEGVLHHSVNGPMGHDEWAFVSPNRNYYVIPHAYIDIELEPLT